MENKKKLEATVYEVWYSLNVAVVLLCTLLRDFMLIQPVSSLDNVIIQNKKEQVKTVTVLYFCYLITKESMCCADRCVESLYVLRVCICYVFASDRLCLYIKKAIKNSPRHEPEPSMCAPVS